VTLPVDYTFLRFNSTNSTISNLEPDGQNSTQPIFNIMNNGNIPQSFSFYLNEIVPNINTYADLDNNFSLGRIEINTTPTVIITNLDAGLNQSIWLVVDINNAPATNINKTLTINNSLVQ
jgi:hypothetical protein